MPLLVSTCYPEKGYDPNGTDLSCGLYISWAYSHVSRQSLECKRHFQRCFLSPARSAMILRSLRRIATACFFDVCGLSQCHSAMIPFLDADVASAGGWIAVLTPTSPPRMLTREYRCLSPVSRPRFRPDAVGRSDDQSARNPGPAKASTSSAEGFGSGWNDDQDRKRQTGSFHSRSYLWSR